MSNVTASAMFFRDMTMNFRGNGYSKNRPIVTICDQYIIYNFSMSEQWDTIGWFNATKRLAPGWLQPILHPKSADGKLIKAISVIFSRFLGNLFLPQIFQLQH